MFREPSEVGVEDAVIDMTPPIDPPMNPPLNPITHLPTYRWGCLHKS